MFLIPSILGVFFFMTPVVHADGITIPIAVLKDALLGVIGDNIAAVVSGVLIVSALAAIATKLFKPQFILNNSFLNGLFNPSPLWFSVRVLGAAFVAMVITQTGPEVIISDLTGAFVFAELMPTLFAVFVFAGLLLPLLTHFGLLELIGSLLTKVMRPLFNLPGRSAIDCLASWLGDGSVGILMSSKQYEEKCYTQREAAVIGTTFSAVSISFSLVVIAQVGLESMFIPFYLTVCVAGLVVALIVPRLPPLSNKKDLLIDGTERAKDAEVIPAGHTVFSFGYQNALNTAAKIEKLSDVIVVSCKNAIDMVFGVLPVVMAVGTMGLIVAEFTPVFAWLGAPFVPLLELLQIPFAEAASETMVVGFADMFIPSIIAAGIENDMTKFVIAALSVTQLIFMSEVGALLLGSKIPVNAFELLVVFLLRTLVSLPVIAGMAHLIF
ncbi:YjiH family protein [Ferrimonas lipolytica]|uniref:YjiH family protein n=1 Tax=Ferrimonas lipolytica TaxID=2724191 RepID=A0A6H1UAV4_9GAMM|nr:YjiH family protein [Ferrimonas lipolytica]QIZ76174.1 YjiH family protein [Ferrimonas lipolytica]